MPSLVGKEVGPLGYGLMGLTWREKPCSEEQAFTAMRASLEAGSNFWNAGEFYGTPTYNSLHLLNRYFTKYPEDASKVVLSIKGGVDVKSRQPDGTPEGVRRSINNCLKVLDGKKKIDIFECARVDPKTDIETTLKELEKCVQEGKIGGISLSEVGAKTLGKAVKVAKIVAVEVEISLWALDPLKNGVSEICAEHNIPIVAYSPIGRGMLTGQIKSLDDMEEGDLRRHQPRFHPDVFDHNVDLVHKLEKISTKKGCTLAQLAISWVLAQSKTNGNPEIIPIPGSTTVERVKENTTIVKFAKEELDEINKILEQCEIKGSRYGGPQEALMEG